MFCLQTDALAGHTIVIRTQEYTVTLQGLECNTEQGGNEWHQHCKVASSI